MNNTSKKYLSDIRSACERALALAEGLSYDAYIASGATPLAVERLLITAGEAINQLRKHDPDLARTMKADVRGIVAVRNILVHNYDSIDQPVVYTIITRYVPELLQEVNALLASDIPELPE